MLSRGWLAAAAHRARWPVPLLAGPTLAAGLRLTGLCTSHSRPGGELGQQGRAHASSGGSPTEAPTKGAAAAAAAAKPVNRDGPSRTRRAPSLASAPIGSRPAAEREGWQGLILPEGMARPSPVISPTESSAIADQMVSIDRSGLRQEAVQPHGSLAHKEPESPMARHLKALIRTPATRCCRSPLTGMNGVVQFRGGPITVAEYMSEVLTNPEAGYYMHRDVFGSAGDFVTSPEVSQMFGEMVGIWCLCTWQQMGSPAALRLVELGPGRGTLMADLLRGTAPFAAFAAALQVDLVEVSPALRQKQWETLRCGSATGSGAPLETEPASVDTALPPAGDANLSGVSGFGDVKVCWQRSLEEVPADVPTIVIAHEFFDALPVHQFQRTERGWCERLVDVAADEDSAHLRFVMSPSATPAVKLLLERRLAALPAGEAQGMEAIEIGAQGMATAAALAARVRLTGGAALVLDYGRDSAYPASARAIRKHQFVQLLEEPGVADLSTHVDFSSLRQAVEEGGSGVTCHGPVTQAHFLRSLGIEARLEALQAGATSADAAQLLAGCQRLLGSGEMGDDVGEGMGLSYKAFAISSSDGAVPVAFETDDK